MQEFEKVQNFQCLNIHHFGEIVAVCLNMKCKTKNRFLCYQCMISKNHCDHIEDCIQFNFIKKFLENTLKILKSPIKMLFPHTRQELELFEKFFSKKAWALNNLKNKIDDYYFVKNNIELIEFAYHLLNYQKQFIKGCFQIIQKEFLIYSIEEVYLQNIDVYQQEAKTKGNQLVYQAYILKSQYKYEEAIRCCDKYLNLQLDPNILCLKGKCLHFLDCLDEAEEIYELAFEVDSEKKYSEIIASNIVMLQMSKMNNGSEVPVPSAIYYKLYNLQSLNIKNTHQIQILVNQRKVQEALVLADQCIAENPENFIALTLKGYCLVYLQNCEKAKAIYEQVKKIYPKYFEAQNLAFILSCVRKDEEIQGQIEQNFDKFNDFDQLQQKMLNLIELSKFEEAKKLLNNYPQHLKNHFRFKQIEILYQLFTEQHEYKNDILGEAEFNKQDQLFLLGLAEIKAGKYRQALQIFEEGLKIDPHHRNILAHQFQIYTILKEQSKAAETYDLLKKIYPDYINELSGKGLINQENFPQLKIHQQQYFESELENFKIQERKAQNFVNEGDYNGAIKIFRSLLAVDPQNELVKLQEIQCWIFLDQTNKALEDLDVLLKYLKNNLQALQLKGYALYKNKKYEMALQIFQEIKRKNCKNQFIINFSNCYFKLKNYEQAQKIYEECNLKIEEEIPRLGMKARYFKIMYCLDYKDQNFKIKLLQEFKEMQQIQKKLNGCQHNYFMWIAVALKYFKIELDYIEQSTKKILKIQNDLEIVKVVYAQILFVNNKIANSLLVYEHILKHNPQNLLALVGIIQLYQIMRISPSEINKFQRQALSINKNAFDENIQKEIFIQEMEQTLERESIMATVLSETSKVCHEYYSSKNSF